MAVHPLQARELLDSASRLTGLDDFGPSSFREGLEVLIDCAEREASLSAAGLELLATMIRNRLINRLQIYDWHRRYPEIGQQKITAPIFIIGLWRTGTTLLSFLLDQDPSNYSLLRWQAAAPCPPPGLDAEADRARIARISAQIDQQHRDAPELAAINQQEASGPTECVLTLSHEFKNLLFDCSLHVPSYYDWNRRTDQRSAYDHHLATLQVLQWRQPPASRWQLKAPGHTISLKALLDVYPDARFVISHRDPATSFASAMDFWETQMRGFTDRTDPIAIGANWARIYDDALADLVDFVDGHDPAAIVELSFPELRDTMKAAEKIYGHFGLPLSVEAERRMRAFASADRPSNPGSHHYSLERYGFTSAELHERFGGYIDRFGIEVKI